jgi:acetyl-CoA acetyltransferase
MTDAFVLGGVRAPVGRYGGGLSHIRVDDLLGQTMAAACERLGVPLERIEDITAGCVNVDRAGRSFYSTRCGQAPAGRPIRTCWHRTPTSTRRTAQNVADRYELSREEIDAFALRSHQHAAAARDSGRFAEEIKPVEIPATRKEPTRTSTTRASATTRPQRSSRRSRHSRTRRR